MKKILLKITLSTILAISLSGTSTIQENQTKIETSTLSHLEASYSDIEYKGNESILPTNSNENTDVTDVLMLTSIQQIESHTIEPIQTPKPLKTYGSFKSYMDYRTITDRTSNQYQLQSRARTGKYGIRMIDGRYSIAIGTGWGIDVGSHVVVELDNGTQLNCIVSDIKDDRHTDNENKVRETYDKTDGRLLRNSVEFIVCKQSMDETAKVMGDISYADDIFVGEVVDVRIED